MRKFKKMISILTALVMVLSLITSVSAAKTGVNGAKGTGAVKVKEDPYAQIAAGINKGIMAHWEFENNLKDTSTNGNDGVKKGKAISYVDGIIGKAASFDGKSYISVPDSKTLKVKDEFSLSLWVYKADMRGKENDMSGAGVPYISKQHDEYEEFPYNLREWWTMEPGIQIYDGEETVEVEAGRQMDIQKWTLLTVTYDGETMSIYFNGELVKNELVSITPTDFALPTYIGFGYFMNQDNYFTGYMDDIRIYNRGLSYEEVEYLYKKAAEIDPGRGRALLIRPQAQVAHFMFDGNFKNTIYDDSIMNQASHVVFGNVSDGTKTGNISFVPGVIGQGAKFNGSSYLQVKDHDLLDLDKGFTFALWLYKEKDSDNLPIFAKFGDSQDKSNYSYAMFDEGRYGQRIDFTNLESDNLTFNSEAEIPAKTWYHLSATFDGEYLKLFINGELDKVEECEANLSHSSGPLWIGSIGDSKFFKGIMDDFRIYNYALTEEEVADLAGMADRLALIDITGKEEVALDDSFAMKLDQTIKVRLDRANANFDNMATNEDLEVKSEKGEDKKEVKGKSIELKEGLDEDSDSEDMVTDDGEKVKIIKTAKEVEQDLKDDIEAIKSKMKSSEWAKLIGKPLTKDELKKLRYIDVTTTAKYSSSDEKIVKVTTGQLQAVGKGTAVISIQHDLYTKTYTITVE